MFSKVAMDLAEAAMAETAALRGREDCDDEIWVSGGGEVVTKPKLPRQPEMGSFCDDCGHFAGRHAPEGCGWSEAPGSCRCSVMQWLGYQWPRPWLPAPEGLRSE